MFVRKLSVRVCFQALAAALVGCGGGGESEPRDAPDATQTQADGGDQSMGRTDGGLLASPDAAPDAPTPQEDAGPSGAEQKCVVILHGKSGLGFATQVQPDYLLVGPTGNADGWGGKQWLYFPDDLFSEMRQIIAQALTADGCTKAVVHGFSNGAAAAAKLYCRGERFDGRVVGYVIDDPVPDHGADGCAPAAGVEAKLYWTTGLAPADGWNCAEGDWTCEGGTTVGIEKYAANLGLTVVRSPNTSHAPYSNPPEYQSWW